MDDALGVTALDGDPVSERPIEFVERKGLGHPDTICDGIAEAVSRALSRTYRERVGRICHHNTDKVQLVAGSSSPAFGGGSVDRPIYVLIGGRATASVDGERIPVRDVARRAARGYLDDTFAHLDADRVAIDARVGESSTDLRSLFGRGGVPAANDTSFGVGHAPNSPLERLVRTVEPAVRDVEGVGADVKVMGLRRGDDYRLTVAAAVVAESVPDLDAYRDVVETARERARDHAADLLDEAVDVRVNAADDYAAGEVYLTETGLSAEMGDDGAVGRGNRANGLITPQRPMSLEAVAGKNPVSHVGKLYNVLADEVAAALHEECGADYAEVQLLSEIGAPVTDPRAVDVRVAGADEAAVRAVVAEHVARVTDLTDRLAAGDIDVF